MTENCNDPCPGIPGEQPGAPNPSQAGVDKESVPNPRTDQPDVKMPAGAYLKFTKFWIYGVTSSPQNSLTDQEARDEPNPTILKRVLEEYGAGGIDKGNFELMADLTAMKEKANIVYWVYWDEILIGKGQMNLPAGSHPVVRERIEYLPDKPFLRWQGDHKLELVAQLRSDMQTGTMLAGESPGWDQEFPHVGDTVRKIVKVTIMD